MKKLIPIILLLSLVLTGCSSQAVGNEKVTVKIDGTQVLFGKSGVANCEYNGDRLTVNDPAMGTYEVWIEECSDLTMMSSNTQGITLENMDKYKKCKTFSEYLNTKFTMCYPVKDNWYYIATGYPTEAQAAVSAKWYNMLQSVSLTTGPVYVDFGCLVFGTEYDDVIVRPTEAIITGVFKVSRATKAECTTPFVVTQNKKEYQLMKYSTEKYDYYQYEDVLIQCSAGLPIGDYVKFK